MAAQATQPFGRAGFSGVAVAVVADGMLFGGPDTPPQQQLLPVQPAQFGAWFPAPMQCAPPMPEEQVLPPFSAPKAKKARKARSRAAQKHPKPPKHTGMAMALVRFGTRPASCSRDESDAAATLPSAMLASASPADDAAELIGPGDVDDNGLQPTALLEAVDLSRPPSEGDAEQDQTMLSMFLLEAA